ncbi:MAG: hypothetical protein U0744_04295 [Gemmataceae bacterium]
MSTGADLLSINGHVLLVAYLASGLLALFRVPMAWRPLLLLGAAWFAIVPFGRASLVGLSRGVLGDLSLPMQALLAIGLLRAVGMRHWMLVPWRRDVASGILIVEVALILTTLGIVPFDVYGAGYAPQGLLLALWVCMIALWPVQPAYALALLAGVFAFAVGGLASPNVWDYVFDPLLLIPCLMRILSFRAAEPSDPGQAGGTSP